MTDEFGEEIKQMYRKAGLTPPEGKGLHTKAFHGCVISYLKKGMSYSEGAKRCMGALGDKAINPSHRRKEEYMEQFDEMLGKYRVTVNPDGTHNIHEVPIFELGTFKSKDGKPYDDEWFDRARQTHEAMKSDNGYLPTFHPGHNSDNGSELPAMGLLDNLKKAGKMVIADLVKIGQDAWAALKDGKYPYRSIEATNGDAPRILSLAMLGSRPPAVKTPPLYAGELPEGVIVDTFSIMVDENVDILECAVVERTEPVKELEQEATNMADEIKDVKETPTPEVKAEEAQDKAAEKLIEKIEQNEKIQMAEQIKALEAKLAAVADTVTKAETAKKEAIVDSFIEKMNATGKLTKSQIDYDGKENSLALRKLMLSLNDEQREQFCAFVGATESVAHFTQETKAGDETDKHSETDDAEKLWDKVNEMTKSYMKENPKASLRDAQKAVLAANPAIKSKLEI